MSAAQTQPEQASPDRTGSWYEASARTRMPVGSTEAEGWDEWTRSPEGRRMQYTVSEPRK